MTPEALELNIRREVGMSCADLLHRVPLDVRATAEACVAYGGGYL